MSQPYKEMILCTRCGGSGAVRVYPVGENKCPRCAGSGRILVDPLLPQPRSENSDTVWEILEEFRLRF
jgi:hypothetical protein